MDFPAGMKACEEASQSTGARAYAQAFQLHRQGRLQPAVKLYRQALQADPAHADALHMLGVATVQSGDAQSGEALIRQSLRIRPDHAGTLSSLGNALRALNRPQDAMAQFVRAIELDPLHVSAHTNLGSVLVDLGRPLQAIASYERALQLRPDHVSALFNYGNLLTQVGRSAEALLIYERALRLQPDLVPALSARGMALLRLQRPQEALASFDRALALQPDDAELLAARGQALWMLRRLEPARETLQRSLKLNPNMAMAYHDLGTVFLDLRRLEEAVFSYELCLKLEPSCAPAHFHRGIALFQLGRHAEAQISYHNALKFAPDYPYARGGAVQARQQLCDWTDWQRETDAVVAAVHQGGRAIIPFVLLAICDSPETQLRCAQTHVRTIFPPVEVDRPKRRRMAGERIRVAYVSADFRDHPVAQLILGVLDRHDRDRFEIVLASLQPADSSALGRRLRAAAGRFHDLSGLGDAAAAESLRELGIDIAVDLQGHTLGSRTGIFAQRAAPVQVNYLGYPGTMGASYMDYLIADATVVPETSEPAYVERIVRLPGCYLPFDDRQPIAAPSPDRTSAGLPAAGFVFCAFNNPFKITPPVFDIWMRLLRSTPGSCLWLRAEASPVVENLRREASVRGVEPGRLVFAPKVGALEQHLARYPLADLFLDTLPYNAHATAANALWAGLPVLSCQGAAFAGRVGASLLRAVRMPEMIASDLQQYEQRALELAHSPQLLAAVRRKLAENRRAAPLFDTERYCRALEQAFMQMYGRLERDELAANLSIP